LAASLAAIDDGTFVWADATADDFLSAAANSLAARASGGARFVNTLGVGVQLPAVGNAWQPASDRALKANALAVDPRAVLEALAGVPIATWNLISQDPSIRHIGPMAQDFKAAFGVGESDRHISTVDADGVAFAAIQGLYRWSGSRRRGSPAWRRRTALRDELAAARTEHAGRQDALEARLAALERRLEEAGR
jgi:Chaperone of endosialidase